MAEGFVLLINSIVQIDRFDLWALITGESWGQVIKFVYYVEVDWHIYNYGVGFGGDLFASRGAGTQAAVYPSIR